MGLDMYLYRKERGELKEVAYWRKANAIHKWFVDNVQEGNDDCGEYPVTTAQLAGLVALCKGVLETVETIEGTIREGITYYPNGIIEQHTSQGPVVAQQNLAATMLPTQDGFFFGSSDYDVYYLQKLQNTVEQLEPLLAAEGEFIYHSSW